MHRNGMLLTFHDSQVIKNGPFIGPYGFAGQGL